MHTVTRFSSFMSGTPYTRPRNPLRPSNVSPARNRTRGGALVSEDRKRVSMDEIEAEDAVSLPNKEVMSLLDVNANVDLGLDLAAPVDLAVAATLTVAAPLEASASAIFLSPVSTSVCESYQLCSIYLVICGTAGAAAPRRAAGARD